MKSRYLFLNILLIVALLGGLLTLGWIRGNLLDQEQAFLESSVRPFELSQVLQRPEENSVRFSELEFMAKSLEERGNVDQLLLTKKMQNGEERVLYPFAHELLRHHWREEVSAWHHQTISGLEGETGVLYLSLNRSQQITLDRAMMGFSVLLTLSILLTLWGFRGQQKRLIKTTSELQERQKEVIRLERLALVGQLSANIFHDLKKPVLNIKHEVSDALEDNHFNHSSAQQIKEQTELYADMLRNLGIESFARGDADKAEYCDLQEIVERSLSLVIYEQGSVQVETHPVDLLPLILCPRTQLIQVVSNLALNAFQAMEQKGVLKIGFEKHPAEVRLKIQDTGPGINPIIAETLFEPFATTKAQTDGSGLGLFISKQIMENLGGSIYLESTQPTCFVLIFPTSTWEKEDHSAGSTP